MLTNSPRSDIINPMKKLLMQAWKKLPIPFFARRWFTYVTNKRSLVGVNGVITNAAGEALLFKHAYRKTPWGMPGGWLGHERPADGLIREVREESGLEIAVDRVADAWYEKNVYGVHVYCIVLIGRVVGGAFRPSAEVSQCGYFRIGDWPDGMREDQKAVIARALGVGA
jgi:8-oxo-dGTP diphosphatase